MKYVRFLTGVFLIVATFNVSANQAELFSIVNTQEQKGLMLKALPRFNSNIIAKTSSKSDQLKHFNTLKTVDDVLWSKMNWKNYEGWIKADSFEKTATTKRTFKEVLTEKLTKEGRFQKEQNMQLDPTLVDSNTPTALLQTNAAQRIYKSKLNCRGGKSEKWKIQINMRTKRMWVDLEDKPRFSVPITYTTWDRESRKRMSVVAGSEKKRVKTTLHRSHRCRSDFTRTRYTYSIDAEIYRSGVVSGCCGDATR